MSVNAPIGVPASEVAVRRARLEDVAYILDLARSESECVGFVPAAAYHDLAAAEGAYHYPNYRLWVAHVDMDPIGFLYYTPGRVGRPARIAQIAIQNDARRIEYGTALVHAAEAQAAETARGAVSARVAADIEADSFWDALGYTLVGDEPGGSRRGRTIHRRIKRLPSGLLLAQLAGWRP